jgi:exosortase
MLARIQRRDLEFLALFLFSIAVFWTSLSAVAKLLFSDDRYSYIAMIPPISAILLYAKRLDIFSCPRGRATLVGTSLMLLAAAIYFGTAIFSLSPGDRLSVRVLAMVTAWAGIFTLCYGTWALRRAVFPLGFLLFMIPIPEALLNWMVGALQSGSAAISAVLFQTLGIPSFRQGFRFLLPGVEIEIANECSGIRSTLSLFIASVLAGHLLLRFNSRRILFSLAAIPIAILKNAVRIVTLSYLGVYVDRAFLTGKLHHLYGGLVFSTLSLALFVPLLLLLRKSERASSPAPVRLEAVTGGSPLGG